MGIPSSVCGTPPEFDWSDGLTHGQQADKAHFLCLEIVCSLAQRSIRELVAASEGIEKKIT